TLLPRHADRAGSPPHKGAAPARRTRVATGRTASAAPLPALAVLLAADLAPGVALGEDLPRPLHARPSAIADRPDHQPDHGADHGRPEEGARDTPRAAVIVAR